VLSEQHNEFHINVKNRNGHKYFSTTNAKITLHSLEFLE